MIKQSVKKPYTILVGVIIILMLASVSLSKMTTDLLPTISTPYLMVVSTYPGASPEKVEMEVVEPMERVLSTVNGVKNVTSNCAENYGMITLEFEDGTNMDSALVKVNSALDTVKDSLPERCSSPNIMEISLDMLATMYVAVYDDNMDIYELTEFANDTVVPYFQRQNGVASVSTVGLVEQMVEVRLDEDAIDDLNDQLATHVSGKLSDAQSEINKAQDKITSGKADLEKGKSELSSKQESTSKELAEATKGLNTALATQQAYEANLNSLKASKAALEAEKKAYTDNGVISGYEGLNTLFATLPTTRDGLVAAGSANPTLNALLTSAGITATTSYPSSVADALSDDGSKLANAVTLIQTVKTIYDMDSTTFAAMATVAGMDTSVLTQSSLQQMYDIINTRIPQIDTELANLATELIAAQAAVDQVNATVNSAMANYNTVEAGKISAAAGFGSAQAQLSSAEQALSDAQAKLDESVKTYNDSRDAALKAANLDQLLNLDTLSGLITAQNFEMPAGYIEDEEDKQWLLKVGTELTELDQLKNLVLADVDGIGEIRLSDVAEITVIDNASDSYARMNGKDAVLLSIYKASTSGTSDVAKTCNNAMKTLEAEHEGLHITPLMDQGEYISMFLSTILQNMVLGALLAILVLILFLRSAKPTLVVAFSIPFSVLLAVLLMYFTGISLNIMSMAGLSLGIGMLVDNSIVVIENIYRIRGKDIPAPRAAVQGAKQVAGAIVSSTLTTVCVFLPMIFTTGMVRELMVPFALTISFALGASLLVALTVAPAMGSVLLRKSVPKQSKSMRVVQSIYGKILNWCLRFKVVPLGIAIALLVVAILGTSRMGLVLIPDMNSNQVYVDITMDEDLDMDACYAKADEICEKILSVEEITSVGAMTNMNNMISTNLTAGTNDYRTYAVYLILDEEVDKLSELKAVQKELRDLLADEEDCEIVVQESSAGDMSSMMSSGLTLNISGEDLETIEGLSEELMEKIQTIDGFDEVSNGQEDGDEVLHLVIDKDKAMGYSLPVAQIYSDISSRLVTDKTSTSFTADNQKMDVKIIDETHQLTVENLMDMEFDVTVTEDDGTQTTEAHKLSEFATIEHERALATVNRQNGTHQITVTATTKEGYNTTRLSEKVMDLVDGMELPSGYTIDLGGEAEEVNDMLSQMGKLLLLGLALVYLVMVAQFQSLLSPFIILFTVPLAFTGGLFGLVAFHEQISIVSLLGFLVLMGTVVNNGIVFVDYTNQLRIAGMKKHDALIFTGKTRMRPILMTALTTILSMSTMVFSQDISAGMSRGMAVVVAAGLLYATLMTLFIVPVMYDILYRGEPKDIDVGDDLEEAPDEVSDYLNSL
ncbi:MAG: efflux RND transporter permease subunit [Lachnospiraceae bacterium]|nr:efflux RND transporter permease subunit [Lachnospiraceae bacterium]